MTNQSYTDSAAAAGIRATDIGDGQNHPFLGACAAMNYLLVNDPQLAGMSSSWKTGAGASVTGDPCAAGAAQQTTVCAPNTSSSWAWYTGTSTSGSVTVDIKTGYTTPDPAFDASGSSDNGLAAQGGCDQLAVIVHETEKPGLGKIASSNNIVTADRPSGEPCQAARRRPARQCCFSSARTARASR